MQADALYELLEDRKYKVLYIEIPLEEVVARNSERVSCRECRTVYNLENNAPTKEGVCYQCCGELYQREDDKEDVIRHRYDVYVKNTKPLVDFYEEKETLVRVAGQGKIDQIFNTLVEVLGIA